MPINFCKGCFRSEMRKRLKIWSWPRLVLFESQRSVSNIYSRWKISLQIINLSHKDEDSNISTTGTKRSHRNSQTTSNTINPSSSSLTYLSKYAKRKDGWSSLCARKSLIIQKVIGFRARLLEITYWIFSKNLFKTWQRQVRIANGQSPPDCSEMDKDLWGNYEQEHRAAITLVRVDSRFLTKFHESSPLTLNSYTK